MGHCWRGFQKRTLSTPRVATLPRLRSQCCFQSRGGSLCQQVHCSVQLSGFSTNRTLQHACITLPEQQLAVCGLRHMLGNGRGQMESRHATAAGCNDVIMSVFTGGTGRNGAGHTPWEDIHLCQTISSIRRSANIWAVWVCSCQWDLWSGVMGMTLTADGCVGIQPDS